MQNTRFVNDLGIVAIDRGHTSCVNATETCRRTCYNRKFLMYPSFRKCYIGKDCNDNKRWDAAQSSDFAAFSRVRICTRGDGITSTFDVDRIAQWCADNPNTLFWVPTRAWRDPVVGGYALHVAKKHKNFKLMASVDDSMRHEQPRLARYGWSTMYYHTQNEAPKVRAFQCPKTWKTEKVNCATCRDGCFSEKRVDVWLKKH